MASENFDERLARELLDIVDVHGALPMDDLAVMTGRTVAEVEMVWRQLVERGIIVRKQVIINWDLLGEERVLARVDLKLVPEREYGFDKVAERIARYPQVIDLQLVSGGYDLSVLIGGKNLREIADFVAQKLAVLDQVSGTMTHFVLKTYKKHGVLLENKDDDHRLEVTP